MAGTAAPTGSMSACVIRGERWLAGLEGRPRDADGARESKRPSGGGRARPIECALAIGRTGTDGACTGAMGTDGLACASGG